MLTGAGRWRVNLVWLVGGAVLLWQKAARRHIPASFPLSLAVCATSDWILSPGSLVSSQPYLLSGVTALGTFFILTDPVIASTTNRGRLIFGMLAGLLVRLIRSFGGYSDGVILAVLLANIMAPLTGYYTCPRVYGRY